MATQSLDILRTHSVSSATSTTILPSLPSPPRSTTIPSSSPSLPLTSADDDRSVDALQATQPESEALASSLPAVDPAPAIPKPTESTSVTSITTSIVNASTNIPFHFHSRLHNRVRSKMQYFHHHFLPSAPLCECNRFPVYSSKLGDPPSGCKLSAVKDLCLVCIEDTLTWPYGTTPEIGAVFFTDQMWDEWDSFYCNFYTKEEQLEIEYWESEEELFLCYDRSMQRIMPWLSKRGVRRTCPHVAGACRDTRCCHGTEAVVVSADSE
jgi:hypothetical protein